LQIQVVELIAIESRIIFWEKGSRDVR
jgi:hypothetical protein